jgi:flagellar biosynthesis/type III secretory pathway protein FliH
VLNVSIFEFDEEKYREVMREDGFNQGFSDGKAVGLVEGKSIGLTEGRLLGAGEERENGIRLLIRTCRSVNIARQNTLEQLASQYSLDTDTAQKYLNMHWN